MKKILLALTLFVSLSTQAQYNTDSLDIQTAVNDTIPEKKKFGEKLAKFFGYDDKEEEIKALNSTIQSQQSVIDSICAKLTEVPDTVLKTVEVKVPTSKLCEADNKSIQKDQAFISSLPKNYNNLPKGKVTELTKMIDSKIAELVRQRDSILKAGGDKKELLDAKDNAIQSLNKEKTIINLTGETVELKEENTDLANQKQVLKKYLYAAGILLFVLILIIMVVLQRKTIKVQDEEIEEQLKDISKKNSYLDYAARVIRHDMHSGINTYIPRGISSLEKRITPEKQDELKIKSAFQMIKDGLAHTQRVYKNVYEFTNLVKQHAVLERSELNLTEILDKHFSATSYSSQVEISELGVESVNEILFCSAVDSIVKNGLRYNENSDKKVVIYREDDTLFIQDNGKGMTDEELQGHINSNKKYENDDSGIGLKICSAILEEHGFSLSCEKLESGTKIKIKLK